MLNDALIQDRCSVVVDLVESELLPRRAVNFCLFPIVVPLLYADSNSYL